MRVYSAPVKLLLLCLGMMMSSTLSFGASPSDSKPIKIKGWVCDTLSHKLPGAVVAWEKGGKVLSRTPVDSEGWFHLEIPKEDIPDSFIRVTLIGYAPVKLPLRDIPANLVVEMKEVSESLSEVVVTGYVDRPKEGYTGSVTILGREVIQLQVQRDLLSILRSEVPGFELKEDIMAGSDPNKVPEMILRGRSTLVEGDRSHAPIFILDGVEVDIATVFDLNPELVDKVTVLKDAAATSFYGSKAANGVVVISTLQPKPGKVRTDYTLAQQFSLPDLSAYHLLTSAEKLEYERLAGLYGSFSGRDKTDIDKQTEYYAKLNRVSQGVQTDWMSEPLRTGSNRKHTVSLSGGGADIRYGLSGSYAQVSGVMDNSSRSSGSIRVSLTYGNLRSRLISYRTWYTTTSESDVPYGSFQDYVTLNPYDSPTVDGTLNRELSFGRANPLYEKSLGSYIHRQSSQYASRLNMRMIVSPQWRVESSISWLVDRGGATTFYSPHSILYVYTEKSKRGGFDVNDSKRYDLQGNIFGVYNAYPGNQGIHSLRITLGGNIQSTGTNFHGYRAVGVLSDKMEHESMASRYPDGTGPEGGRGLSRMLGAYMNLGYAYKDKYLLEGSFRYEGSTKFGSRNRFAPFSSFSAGWNLHKEEWIRHLNPELLKLRAGVGYVGNAGFGPYESRLTYRYDPSYAYDDQVGAMPMGLVNPSLKWERTLKYNLGLDFAFVGNRVTGNLDWYHNLTSDLIVSIAKPPHLGFQESKENLGKICNSGVELSLRGQLLHTHHTAATAYLTLSHNRNRILQISDMLKNKNRESEQKGQKSLPVTRYSEGESMTALRVLHSVGINPANGREVFLTRNGEYTYEYDYRDKVVVGDSSPVVSGSMGFTFSWRRFLLSSGFIYRLGATLYNQTLATKVEGSDPMLNADSRVFSDRWKSPGDIVRFKHIASREFTPPTSRFVEREYMLEGSSLMASYTFPSEVLNHILSVRELKLSLSLGNFLYLSTVHRERGLDYPFSRSIQMALHMHI